MSSDRLCYAPHSGKKLAKSMRDAGIGWFYKHGKLFPVTRWEVSVRTGIKDMAVIIGGDVTITKLSHWFDGALAGDFADYSVRLGNRARGEDEDADVAIYIKSDAGSMTDNVVRFDVKLEVDVRENNGLEIMSCVRKLQFEYNRSHDTIRWLGVPSLAMWPPTYDPAIENMYTFPDGYMSTAAEPEVYDVIVPLREYIL